MPLRVFTPGSIKVISPVFSFCFVFFFAGSFEIEINGQLIFSKLETSGFPYEDDVSNMQALKRTPAAL